RSLWFIICFRFLSVRRTASCPLFPYTTLFRSRFLVTAEAYSVPATLVFNKLDLFSEEGLEILEEYVSIYSELGYPCYEVSALERSEEHTSELQSRENVVCRLLLEKKTGNTRII